MSSHFAIFRKEATGYSSMGPTSKFLDLDAAKAELTRLKKNFPLIEFVLLGEVGTASRSEEVTVTISNPVHDETPLPWPKRVQA